MKSRPVPLFTVLSLALAMSSCASTKYKEILDPATGRVLARELKIGGNVNVLTAGDLSNADDGSGGLLGGLLGGGRRSSVASQTAADAFAQAERPTIRSGEFEFFGTLEHTSPIAAQGRSVTGALEEIRRGVTRGLAVDALRADRVAGHQADAAQASAGAATDQARIAAEVEAAQIAANRDIALEGIRAGTE